LIYIDPDNGSWAAGFRGNIANEMKRHLFIETSFFDEATLISGVWDGGRNLAPPGTTGASRYVYIYI